MLLGIKLLYILYINTMDLNLTRSAIVRVFSFKAWYKKPYGHLFRSPSLPERSAMVMAKCIWACLSVCMSVRTHNSKTFAPIDLMFYTRSIMPVAWVSSKMIQIGLKNLFKDSLPATISNCDTGVTVCACIRFECVIRSG